MPRKKFKPWVYLGILKRQKMICACGCGDRMSRAHKIEFNHILGLEEGGEDEPGNLEAVKHECHKRITKGQAQRRGKTRRIRKQNGLMTKKMSKRDKVLASRQRWLGMP